MAAVAAPLALAARLALEDQALPAGPAAAQTESSPALPRVAVERVRSGPLVQWVMAEGTVRAIRRELLHFEVRGRIVAIGRDADDRELREGIQVRGPSRDSPRGQLLVQVDPRETEAAVAQAEAALNAARERGLAAEAALEAKRIALAAERRELTRADKLLAKGTISSARQEERSRSAESAAAAVQEAEAAAAAARAELARQRAALDAARLQQDKSALHAPFDGRIARLNARVGQRVSGDLPSGGPAEAARAAAVILLDESAWELLLHLPPGLAQGVEPGQRAYAGLTAQDLIRAEARAFRSVAGVAGGEVWSVGPSVTRDKRSVLVRLRFESAAAVLSDGLPVTAWIEARRSETLPLVDQQAIVGEGPDVAVFVYDEASRQVERRPIEIGLSGLRQAAVTSGLAVDETIVVRGHHLLVAGDRVQARPRQATSLAVSTR